MDWQKFDSLEDVVTSVTREVVGQTSRTVPRLAYLVNTDRIWLLEHEFELSDRFCEDPITAKLSCVMLDRDLKYWATAKVTEPESPIFHDCPESLLLLAFSDRNSEWRKEVALWQLTHPNGPQGRWLVGEPQKNGAHRLSDPRVFVEG